MLIGCTKKLQDEMGITAERGHEEDFDLREDCKVVLESEVLIKDYIKDGFIIKYCYDFGDNWQRYIGKNKDKVAQIGE